MSTLSAKYLNFAHAIMMIEGVGEFTSPISGYRNENDTDTWAEKMSSIIEYTRSIHYRTCAEWDQELGNVGFHLCATLHYAVDGSSNPQKLFYAVYQLRDKK